MVPDVPGNARYIHFESILASGIGERWVGAGTLDRICEKSHFRNMRDLAYTLNARPIIPANRQPRIHISFLYKKPGDKRRMVVDKQVLEAVQARFPDADIKMHDATVQDTDTQVAWLSRTSVFIANVGSPSFRMVYLPDGAQARI